MKHLTSLLTAAAAAALLLAGCRPAGEPVSRSDFLLNTFVTVTLYEGGNNDILNQCIDICKDYEGIFSKTIESSEIYRMNHRKPGETEFTLSEPCADLIGKGLYYSRLSEGAFDITIEPLSSLWDFTSGTPQIPPADQVQAAAARVDYRNLSLEGNRLTFLSPDTSIDLGSIAKGYIADRMKEYLKEQGVTSAIINLGGNVLCLGEMPDGEPFRIGLQDPSGQQNSIFANLTIHDQSVVTSGVYERHFEINGVNYHHLLNPRTGYPYENGLVSVTIISPLSVDGDGLSTTCFSLGLTEGIRLLDTLDDTCGIFMTDDGKVHFSEGAEDYVEYLKDPESLKE